MSANEHIELIPAKPEHAEELSRICHRAFDTLHERHRVHRDVPDEGVGRLIIGGVLHRPDYVGVVAARGGRIIGSNFLQLADAVCGVGPITVEPGVQARGVGRRLMQWVIDEARRRRGDGARVRLFQEAVNTASLSLYTSLGFRWRETAALMQPPPAVHDDPSVRPMTTDDLPEAERLSERHSGSSRVNDTARLLSMGLPAFVRERAGRVAGYQVATLFGHASAETDDDLLTLASQTARRVPPPMAVVIVPMSRAPLFGAALASGFRVLKVLNGMSLGPCAPSPGPTFPSIQC
ncbi:MAG: GNAT family N-acetyltransferase [Phycisphaeraceae bacterium]|nr:MAG: GNAT family N-acetyltransferase [Phycisphaeraceae bacterium]